eukprot:scaffold52518_cov17-Prasinocladus_malaysianus.AAC.1
MAVKEAAMVVRTHHHLQSHGIFLLALSIEMLLKNRECKDLLNIINARGYDESGNSRRAVDCMQRFLKVELWTLLILSDQTGDDRPTQQIKTQGCVCNILLTWRKGILAAMPHRR